MIAWWWLIPAFIGGATVGTVVLLGMFARIWSGG
jgi:hypothetical protein